MPVDVDGFVEDRDEDEDRDMNSWVSSAVEAYRVPVLMEGDTKAEHYHVLVLKGGSAKVLL